MADDASNPAAWREGDITVVDIRLCMREDRVQSSDNDLISVFTLFRHCPLTQRIPEDEKSLDNMARLAEYWIMCGHFNAPVLQNDAMEVCYKLLITDDNFRMKHLLVFCSKIAAYGEEMENLKLWKLAHYCLVVRITRDTVRTLSNSASRELVKIMEMLDLEEGYLLVLKEQRPCEVSFFYVRESIKAWNAVTWDDYSDAIDSDFKTGVMTCLGAEEDKKLVERTTQPGVEDEAGEGNVARRQRSRPKKKAKTQG